MTDTKVTPYRREPLGNDGFAQLVRAELTKFRTVRSWVITLGIAAALIVVFAWVGSQVHSGSCTSSPGATPVCTNNSVPVVPVGPGKEPVVDTFSFLHQPLVGNGSVTAEVSSLTEKIASTNGSESGVVPWAKAGVIIKENTTQGSAYAAVMVTPDHGVRMQYDYINDTAGIPGAVSASAPRWLRLTRDGDLVTGYDSLDGIHWTEIGTVGLPGLTESVQAGLFVTSPASTSSNGCSGFCENGLSSTVATATFGQVHLSGDLPDSDWKSQVVGANTQIYISQSAAPSWFKQSDGTFTLSGSGDIAPQVASGVLGIPETMGLLASGVFGLIPAIVLAALFMTSEYRRRLIRTTLTASPRRGRVLAAKAVAIGSVTFVAASVGTAIAVTLSRHELYANGNYLFPLSAPSEVRVDLGTGLVFAVAAVLVMSLGTILRRSAGTVALGIVLFVLPFILGAHPSSSSTDWLMRVSPLAAFAVQETLPRYAQVASAYTMQNGYYPLGPWAGLAVLVGYAAVAFGVATLLIRRRDV
jgi:ABC-type transport system involved in multi-copper enzyme maturation permease subunit